MSEQLQHLIEKIHAEGVLKADEEARLILVKARETASCIEREAGGKAEALIQTAETASRSYAEHGRKALEQASRDLVLTVSQAVEALFTRLLQAEVGAAFTPEAFRSFLHDVVKSYLEQGHSAASLEVTVPVEKAEALRDSVLKAFQQEAAQGVTIRSSNDLIKGFRVAFKDSHVEHDFTPEAIAEALSRLVRPHLSQLLRSAVSGAAGGGAGTP